MDDPATQRPIPRSRLSKTPSWITLGFILGALFVWSLPKQEIKPPAPAPTPTVHLERPKLTEIEAVFTEWGAGAIWENDITEVALWDIEKHSYSLFYEVLRSGDAYYFRSIPHLTRPLLNRDVNPQAPLLFTETEKTRRAWLDRVQAEAFPDVPHK